MVNKEKQMAAPILNKQDEKRALASISKNTHAVRNKAALMIGLYAGLRAKEIAALRICDVAEVDLTIKAELKLTTTQCKNSKSRSVPINKKLAAALVDVLAANVNKKHTAPLIQSQKQQCFSARGMTQMLSEVFNKANLSSCTAHSLRRSFITRLANNAVNLRAIQKMSGHANLNNVQLYVDVMPEQLFNAVEGL